MNKTFHLIILSLFVAQSLVLYIVEGMLPVPFIAPGAKLGLANLITVIALYALPRKRDVALILLLRIILSTAFGGGINAFSTVYPGLPSVSGACSSSRNVANSVSLAYRLPAAFFITSARFSWPASL